MKNYKDCISISIPPLLNSHEQNFWEMYALENLRAQKTSCLHVNYSSSDLVHLV